LSAEPGLHPILAAVFRAFGDARINWCLLSDEAELAEPIGSVDLLIDRSHARRANELFTELGFVRQSAAPSHGGQAPFVIYCAPTDLWIKLRALVVLGFGARGALRTGAEAGCLARRRDAGCVSVLAHDDAFWTMLLAAVLGGGPLLPPCRARLQNMADRARSDGEMGAILDRVCPAGWNASRMLTAARSADWQALEELGPLLARSWSRKQGPQAWIHARLSAQTIGDWSRTVFEQPGISIALLGPDGAGKSTLAAALARSPLGPVKCIYMGLWQRSSDPPSRLNITGLAWSIRILKSWRRYAIARIYLALGYLVIFDRYTFDALLPSGTPQDRLRKIASWLLAHACPAPDLVFVLDAPGSVMYARKGEHKPDYLEAQRQRFLMLSELLPNARTIDATREADAVRRDVLAHVWRRVSGRAG
jgi:thymidylate kinase